jgi:putative ABC transport system permease protein
MRNSGNTNCNVPDRKPGFAGLYDCTWIQFWFETASSSDRSDLQNFLDNYVHEQYRLGRMQRQQPPKLYNVMEWLEDRKVVGKDATLSVWLSFAFLALCLVNTIGLLLAKFSVRAPEVGVRRALGASRREIFSQFLVETAVVGLVGGGLGLALSWGALALMEMATPNMKNLAHMDLQMLGFTFVLSVAAAIVAGLLPTWRACQVAPAIQLKSQ